MDDNDEVMMFVYFKFGQYSGYRIKYSIAKWAIEEYYSWFPNQKKEIDKLVKFAQPGDLKEHTGFISLREVAAISIAVVDKEQQDIDRAMKMKQLEVLKKSEVMIDKS